MPVRSICMWLCFAVTVSVSGRVPAQESVPFAATPEVVYVDPGEFLPEEFRELTPGEDRPLSVEGISQLLRDEHDVDVDVDLRALLDEGITPEDEGFWLGGVPVYVAIDQFCENVQGVSLGWYLEADVLVITSWRIANDKHFARAIDVARLADAGLSADSLSRLLDWAVLFPNGIYNNGTSAVGNVIHMRSPFYAHLSAVALIKGLQTPGQIRYLNQSELNAPLRNALSRRLQLPEGPYPILHLVEALEDLLDVSIWVDELSLSDEGISLAEVVQVSSASLLPNRLVEDVGGVELAFAPRNGRLWLTTAPIADEFYETVIYDVSDLLSRDVMVDDVIGAIEGATSGRWPYHEGLVGEITEIEALGLLVIRQTGLVHREIQALLADQRRLMRIETPTEEELTELQVRGYELNLETAEDVADLVPEVISPDTWRTAEHPDRIGWTRVVALGNKRWPGSGSSGGFFSNADEDETNAFESAATEWPTEKYGMLVVRQTRGVHQTIEDWLEALHSAEFRDSASNVPSVDLTVD